MKRGSDPKRAVVERTDLNALVGKAVYNIRKGLKLTQETMAKRVGLNPNTIGSLERGQANITLASLSELAIAYNVEPKALISDHSELASGGRVTLDTLAQLTKAIDTRVQEMLGAHGPIPIGQAHLASVLGALFDAISKAGLSESSPRHKAAGPV